MKTEQKNREWPCAADAEQIVSAAECTGLVPAAVQTPEEGDAYADLYAIHRQKPVRERRENPGEK